MLTVKLLRRLCRNVYQKCKVLDSVVWFACGLRSLRNLPYLQVHKGNLAVLKDNQREIKVEQTNRPPKPLIIAPKGFSKVLQSNVNEHDNNMENDNEKIEDLKKPLEAEEEKTKIQNGGQTVPPKPLPRASRTNSISEEEPKPVARPRTSPNPGSVVTSVNPNAIGGYKVIINLKKKLMLYKGYLTSVITRDTFACGPVSFYIYVTSCHHYHTITNS